MLYLTVHMFNNLPKPVTYATELQIYRLDMPIQLNSTTSWQIKKPEYLH